jgi:hypothetical protein
VSCVPAAPPPVSWPKLTRPPRRSTTTTDDEAYLEDQLADAAFYDHNYGVPSPVTSPFPDLPPPTAKDKGKGKAVGDADDEQDNERASKDGEVEVEETPERKRNRKELDRLALVDDWTCDALIRQDPTPVSALSTAAKLIKSLHLLQRAFTLGRSFSSADEVDPRIAVARAPDPFPVETYAALLELLGSALSDVSAGSHLLSAADRASRDKVVYELQVQRAKFDSDPTMPWPDAGAARDAWGLPQEAIPLTKKQREDLDLANLYADQARATLLILRPPILRPSTPPAACPTSADPSSIPASSLSSPIGKLPPELLATIFTFARKAAEDRIDSMFHEPSYDEYGAVARPVRSHRRMAGRAMDLEGSRTAGQRFAHSLSLVCRDWRAASRCVAFRSIHIRKPTQVNRRFDIKRGSDC